MGRSDSKRCSAERVRRARITGAVALCVLAAMLLLSSTAAFAFPQHGHAFGSSFGETGLGAGQLSAPNGVAVNETTGDVYVVDRGNNRIERFTSGGTFISAIGYGVADGKKESEICTSACKPGVIPEVEEEPKPQSAKGQLFHPEGIAVDNSKAGPSAGDLYVVGSTISERSYLLKYQADGTFIGGSSGKVNSKEETESFGRIEGVAVDRHGVVWTDWSFGYIINYTNGEPNKRVNKEEEPESEAEPTRPGFAVDSAGDVFVNYEPAEKYEENEETGLGEGGQEPCEKAACFTAKVNTHETKQLAPGEILNPALDSGKLAGLADDLSNDNLYVAGAGSIGAFAADGSLIQRFGAGHLTRASGVAINSGTGAVYVADAGADKVDIFPLEPAAEPKITELSAEEITAEAAKLEALVDPTGAATTVTFQFGTSSCAGGGCASSPPTVLPAVFGDQDANVSLVGLAPDTTYFYRVLAKNSFGEVTSGEERTFTTQVAGFKFSLPDGRAWELVSPAEKNGAGIESIPREGGLIQASADGSAITYITTGPSESDPEGNRSPAFTQNLANRTVSEGASSWSSKSIVIPFEKAIGDFPGQIQEYMIFSDDLKQAILEPRGLNPQPEPALSPDTTEKTLYVRHNVGCLPAPSNCYVPIVTAANDTAGTEFGGQVNVPQTGVHFIAASPDSSHVILSSEVALTTEPVASVGQNFYEWSAGKPPAEQLQLINVLPGGTTPASFAEIGGIAAMIRHVLSDDGSRVIFSASGHLYMRDMVKRETVQLDTPQGVEPGELGPHEKPLFQTASADLSRIFFTDEQRLTGESEAQGEEGKPDLYEFDAISGELTDLATGSASEAAALQGLVPGAGDDGSSVYFVANGVLASNENSNHDKAAPGECTIISVPGAACNLYVVHLEGGKWQPPEFVARLSNEDEPDWSVQRKLSEMTSRVSPNGRYLAFMSNRSLTGYNNRDVDPAAKGAADEEVFLFDSSSKRLTCASCDPTGARPRGVFDTEESQEGQGLLVDRSITWQNRWLAGNIPGWTRSNLGVAYHQSRYLSDTGRLYFNAPDALVPADENGKNDVYQYEPAGQGSCTSSSGCVSLMSSGESEKESAFLDASASGDDLFLLTASKLVEADRDSNFDVYDTHVCTGSSPCVTGSSSSKPSCESAASCKPGTVSTPAFGAAASATAPSSGNVPPGSGVSPAKVVKSATPPKKLTRAQQLAKALKACNKQKTKKKRTACKKRAHKNYGVKKSSHKARKSRRSHAHTAGSRR